MSVKDVRNQKYLAFLDKERILSYDLNALAIIEEEAGENIFQMLQKLEKFDPVTEAGKISFRDIRILLYAGLKSEDETMTISQAGKLAGIGNVKEILEIIVKAFNISMPEPDPNKKK